jgi:predicted GNAT family acetyltransferase
MNESKYNQLYNFVRSLQLENTPLSNQAIGVSIYTSMRVSKLYGNLPNDTGRYDPNIWPPHFPPNADEIASINREHYYFRVRNEKEIKHSLSNLQPVIVNIPYYSQWHHPENGVIQFPSQNEPTKGYHAILIIGYRENDQYFQFKNSWGVQWGDNGYGWLPYGYIEQYATDAVVATNSTPLRSSKKSGKAIETWGIVTPARGLLHGINIFDYSKNSDVAWAFAFEDTTNLDVEEFFVAPQYRKQGFARELMSSIRTISRETNKPLRYFLPNIDNITLGQDIHDIAWKFNLHIQNTDLSWASKILTDN